MRPLLEVLKEKGELTRQQAYTEVIAHTGMTAEQVAVPHSSNGKSIVKGRIGWASSYLSQANALLRPHRGTMTFGPNGQKLLDLNRSIKPSDLREIPEWKALEDARNNKSNRKTTSEELSPEESSPDDLIEQGYSQLKSDLISELLENIVKMDPSDFETLVLKLLAALGYGGGNFQSMQGVPRGPDGGIDGRINEDQLGLDQIYIQAKRYTENSIGRPTVQSFIGAMTGGGCRKGVFVTSSTFTAEAKAYANDLRDMKLVLIDGKKLAELMIQHEVGVQVKSTYRISKVDHDFFESF
ncbi:restriction endonuclease [Akkermansiaceae bacterium]|nr:restriction endonuclease [Akkermansiaceae bacterium]MDB4675592.1 restriction endonuclease [Akkermansiaceae bacterium]